MVLGLDGGGTKTECVLMDETFRVLATSRSGPSNPTRVGFAGAVAAVCEAARMAVQLAAIRLGEIEAVCAGLAGAALPESERKLKKLLQQEFPERMVHVCTDQDLTLEAAGRCPAIALIAGTGSAAVGRGRDGKTVRVGGHGPLLGDEGGAYDVGQRAAIAALRANDCGRPDSALARRILRELQIADWREFQLRVYAAPDDVFPKIFPVIAAASEDGDDEARKLLRDAASALAGLVADLLERLRLKEEKVLLVKSGGMVGRSRIFDDLLDAELRQVAPQAEFATPTMSAAEAAARMALRLSAEVSREEK